MPHRRPVLARLMLAAMSDTSTVSRPMALRDFAPVAAPAVPLLGMDAPALGTRAARRATDGPSTSRPMPHPDMPSDRDFMTLRAAYRASGGIVRVDDLVRWMAARHIGAFMRLARGLVGGSMCVLEWHRTAWVPMFQFDLRDMTVKPGPREVLAELGDGWAGWPRAAWFVTPHPCLAGRCPAEWMDAQADDAGWLAVLAAARADRVGDRLG